MTTHAVEAEGTRSPLSHLDRALLAGYLLSIASSIFMDASAAWARDRHAWTDRRCHSRDTTSCRNLCDAWKNHNLGRVLDRVLATGAVLRHTALPADERL